MRFTKGTSALAAGLTAVAMLPGAAHAEPVEQQSDTAYASDGVHSAVNVCVATAVDSGSARTVWVQGHASATGAVATMASCGIVQNGRVVARWQAALPGPLVATGGTATIPGGSSFSVCANVYARFPDGAEVYDYNCP